MNLLTISEAAEKLRLSKAWLRQRIFRKEIRYVKLGRRVFIPESTIEDLIEKGIFEPKCTNRK